MKLSAVVPLTFDAFPALPRLAGSLVAHGFDEIVLLYTDERTKLGDVQLPDDRFRVFQISASEIPRAIRATSTGDWIAVFSPDEQLMLNPDAPKATLHEILDGVPAAYAVAFPVVDADDSAGRCRIGNAVEVRAVRREVVAPWTEGKFDVPFQIALKNLDVVRQRLPAFYLERGDAATAVRVGEADKSPIGKRHFLRARAQLDTQEADAAIGRTEPQRGLAPSPGPGLWLNIGCNRDVLPGFQNLDRQSFAGVVQCDVRLGLPYADGATEVIVASHILEHLHPWRELPYVLKEFHRVLAPGGLARVSVPDLEILLHAYETRDFGLHASTQEILSDVPFMNLPRALQFSSLCFGNNSGNAVYDGHQAIWDDEALAWALRRAGFKSIYRVLPGHSQHPSLMNKYADAHPEQSLILEAIK